MKKLWGKKLKWNDDSPSVEDKAVQCDCSDPYVRILILEKLPKFTKPFDENFNNYLQQLQHIMEALKIDENEKVGLLFACIQGSASEKLKRSHLHFDDNSTWKHTTNLLHAIFDPLQPAGNIQTLRQMKQQQNQNIHDYVTAVRQLVNNIFLEQHGYTHAQRENETIRYTIRGAKKEIKDQLKGQKYSNIEELMKKAQTIETKINSINMTTT